MEFQIWGYGDMGSYFTTAKISFTSILYPQFTHVLFIISALNDHVILFI